MDGVHRGVHGPGVSVNGSPTQAIQVNIQHVAWFSNYKYNCCKKQKSYSLSFQAKKLMETPLCNIFQLFTHLLGKEDSKGATFMYNRSSWLFTRLPFEEKYKTMNRSGNEIKEPYSIKIWILKLQPCTQSFAIFLYTTVTLKWSSKESTKLLINL